MKEGDALGDESVETSSARGTATCGGEEWDLLLGAPGLAASMGNRRDLKGAEVVNKDEDASSSMVQTPEGSPPVSKKEVVEQMESSPAERCWTEEDVA